MTQPVGAAVTSHCHRVFTPAQRSALAAWGATRPVWLRAQIISDDENSREIAEIVHREPMAVSYRLSVTSDGAIEVRQLPSGVPWTVATIEDGLAKVLELEEALELAV